MKTAKHNLSHYKLATMDMGRLYPVGCVEVIQGDTFKHKTHCFLRLAPMNAPIMHPIQVRLHHWFVPYRILWGGFEDFITSKNLQAVSPYFTISTTNSTLPGFVGSLQDYLNINCNANNVSYSIFAPLAYYKIWAEFYADEQLHSGRIGFLKSVLDKFAAKTDASVMRGGDLTRLFTNASRALSIDRVSWNKDYFTTARPAPQLGPDLGVPISPSHGASGKQLPTIMQYINGPQAGKTAFVDYVRNRPITGAQMLGASATTTYDGVTVDGVQVAEGNPLVSFDGLGKINGVPISSQSVNLRELRAAFALQKIFINRNEYGNRFSEYLAYQGIKYSDRSLQLPQYLGGGKDYLYVSEVLNNTSTNSASMYGHGVGFINSNSYLRYFEEPGIVLSLLSLVPKNVYMNGMHRMYSRRTQEDFFQPELQFLDMQEVKNKEIYVTGTSKDNETFGYQSRYDEFRSVPSSISGDFRTTLKDWHLAREFSTTPVLNAYFSDCYVSKRIFASQTGNPVLATVKHRIIARRHLIKKSKVKVI